MSFNELPTLDHAMKWFLVKTISCTKSEWTSHLEYKYGSHLSPPMKIWQFREPFWALTALKSKLWKNIFSKNMKRESNHSNVTFVTKVFLKRAICQNTLLLSTILTTHSNVIFVTKFFCKEQFKETYCWYSWKEEKMWMSLCNQKIEKA